MLIKSKKQFDFNLIIKLLLFCFIIISYFFHGKTGKWDGMTNIFVFQFITILFSILICIYIILNSKIYQFTSIDTVLSIWIFYIFINSYLRGDNVYNREGLLNVLLLSICYISFRVLFSNEDKSILYVSVCFSIMGCIVSIHGLSQFFDIVEYKSDYFRLSGSYNNPHIYSGYIVSIFPFSLLSIKHGDYFKMKYSTLLGYFSAILMVIILLITQSRGAWLAVAASIVYFFYAFSESTNIFIKRYLSNKALFILGLMMMAFVMILLFYLKKDSSIGRLLIWRVSTEMILDNPIFGIGYGNFSIMYADYQSNFFLNEQNIDFERVAGMNYYAFNEFLKIFTELGIMGLIIYIWFIYSIFFDSIPNKNTDSNFHLKYAKCTLIGSIVFSLFSYPLEIVPIFINYLISAALIANYSDSHFSCKIVRPIRIFISIFLLMIFISIGYLRIQKYSATKKWKNAIDLYVLDRKRGVKMYEKVYPLLTDKGEFLFNYGAVLCETGFYNRSITILNQAKTKFNHIDLYLYLGKSYSETENFQKAEESYLHAKNMIPNRFMPSYLLVELYKKKVT